MSTRLKAGMAAVAFGVAAFAMSQAAEAKTTTYHFTLSGKQETPPNDSKGTGTGTVTYNDETKEIAWHITYSGLTGDATMAHFHGPAKVGVPAGVMVPIGPKGGGIMSPAIGSTTLTDEQAKALTDGQLYFNVHTAAHPDGELRGQLVKGGGAAKKKEAKPQ